VYATPPLAKIYEGKVGPYPVVLSLEIGPKDGEVSGVYYYVRKNAKTVLINLAGKRSRDAVTLHESLQEGEETGQFDLVMAGREIGGTWHSLDGQRQHRVALTQISTEPRRVALSNAILDALDQRLRPVADSGQSTSGLDEAGCGPYQSDLSYLLKNDFIRSLRIWSSYPCGPYPNAENGFVTYNAQTRKPISIWEEIDPSREAAFRAHILNAARLKLDAWRRSFSDEEWVNVLGLAGEQPPNSDSASDAAGRRKRVAGFFASLDPMEIVTSFYVSGDGVHLGRCGLWGLPHVAAAMDYCDDIVVGPRELEGYLKPNSILRKIKAAP
jgi:hypothetical protein